MNATQSQKSYLQTLIKDFTAVMGLEEEEKIELETLAYTDDLEFNQASSLLTALEELRDVSRKPAITGEEAQNRLTVLKNLIQKYKNK